RSGRRGDGGEGRGGGGGRTTQRKRQRARRIVGVAREGIEILHEGKDIEIPAHTGSDLEGSGTAEIVDVVIEFDREIRVGSDQESDRQVPCPDRVARAGGLGGPGYSFADIEEGYRGWRTVLGVAKVRASRRRVERDSGPGAVIGIELIARCRLCQSLLGNENGQRQED